MTNSQPSPSPSRAIAGIDRIRRSLLILMLVLVCLGFVTLVITVTAAYFWSTEKERVVQEVRSAGRVLTVSQTSGLWTHALVETDRGYFGLEGGVSLYKQEPLTLEVRGNRSRFLCDSGHRCTKLMSSFTGE